MNKYFVYFFGIVLFVNFSFAQKTEIVYLDRFDNNNAGWEIINDSEGSCLIEKGGLMIENKRKKSLTFFTPKNIKDLDSKAYTDISFNFSIENVDLKNDGGVGFLFINSLYQDVTERVILFFFEKSIALVKEDNNDEMIVLSYVKINQYKDINNVKIILDNKNEKDNKTKIYLNNELVISNDWVISNFQKIGLASYGLHKTFFDNIIIKQDLTLHYSSDIFDVMKNGDKFEIDHNGVKTDDLLEFIPFQFINIPENITTVSLINKLKSNKDCSNFKTKKVKFNDSERKIISFNYKDVYIDFFIDTNRPNPISIYFLTEESLNRFFYLYVKYNSLRLKNNIAQWPNNSWYSINKYDESYKAVIWRGMP